MLIKSFVFNPFYENTYIVSSGKDNAYIFDPGCYETHEVTELTDFIESEGLMVKAIINTHCHIDHVLGNEIIKVKYKAPLMIPINEQEIFNAMPVYAPQWGMSAYRHAEANQFLREGDPLDLDEVRFDLIEVPGHSPGHLIFYVKSEQVIIGGDVLFRDSIGRTDLPGGNHEELLTNIQRKVYTLPDNVTVLPGHGPETTIGYEKKNNSFVKA